MHHCYHFYYLKSFTKLRKFNVFVFSSDSVTSSPWCILQSTGNNHSPWLACARNSIPGDHNDHDDHDNNYCHDHDCRSYKNYADHDNNHCHDHDDRLDKNHDHVNYCHHHHHDRLDKRSPQHLHNRLWHCRPLQAPLKSSLGEDIIGR